MLIPAPAMFACSFEISDFVDRTAVNAHADAKFGMIFQRLADLERAQDRRFGLVRKTSAPPSPVGNRSSLPSASAARNCSVPRTISFSF